MEDTNRICKLKSREKTEYAMAKKRKPIKLCWGTCLMCGYKTVFLIIGMYILLHELKIRLLLYYTPFSNIIIHLVHLMSVYNHWVNVAILTYISYPMMSQPYESALLWWHKTRLIESSCKMLNYPNTKLLSHKQQIWPQSYLSKCISIPFNLAFYFAFHLF